MPQYQEMDEVYALIQQAAQQQVNNRVFEYGHIVDYDSTSHSVRVLLPNLVGPVKRDGTGNLPYVTNWMPLMSPWVGNGFGMQVVPIGGANTDSPADYVKGEQVIVEFIDTEQGIMASASLYYSDRQQPPGNALMNNNAAMVAGETILQHQSGSYVYFKNNGDIILNPAPGQAVRIGTGVVDPVMLNSIIAKFNTHIHAVAGVITLPPDVPSLFTAADQTTNLLGS